MNSSAALIWEIWRKNRWGFALLVVLLAVCMALSGVVVQLQQKVDRLVSAPPIAAVRSSQPPLLSAPADAEVSTVASAANPEFAEEVSQATMIAQSWREGAFAWSAMLMSFSFLVLCVIFASAEPHTAR